jgi:pimeloyl-ACP methyl ester carboxylesterase
VSGAEGVRDGAAVERDGAAVERRRVRVGSVAGRVLLAGPADAPEAVVFVHGNPGSADDWERLAAAVGAVGRAVAPDLPDFGETEAPDGFEHTVAGYAGYLDAALRELGVERTHLVLHDFGGPIGLAWAASAPDRIASVTLIDTGVLRDYRWHGLARIWRTPVLGELFQASTTRFGFRAAIRRGEPMGLPRDFLDRMYRHYDRRTRRAVLRLYRATDRPGDPDP